MSKCSELTLVGTEFQQLTDQWIWFHRAYLSYVLAIYFLSKTPRGLHAVRCELSNNNVNPMKLTKKIVIGIITFVSYKIQVLCDDIKFKVRWIIHLFNNEVFTNKDSSYTLHRIFMEHAYFEIKCCQLLNSRIMSTISI